MLTLEVKNLFVRYHAEPVLKNINFSLEHPEILAIIGPNGSGKTTLLQTILGFLHPDSGSISIGGMPPKRAIKHYAGKIAYLPQHHNTNLLLPLTVYDIVTQGFKARKIWSEKLTPEEHAQAEEALLKVNLQDKKYSMFRDLSGGQRQRALIALALSSKPQLLFMDEPSTALDFTSIDRFYHLLSTLRSERDMGIVIISHDIGAIAGSADRIALLMNEFKYIGSTRDLPESIMREVFGCHVRLLPDDPSCSVCEGSTFNVERF